MDVRFYDEIADEKLKFAVIAAKCKGKWVFCRHRQRDTWEFPGGHREAGESIEQAAHRELYEETGAVQYKLTPVCIYSVTGRNRINQSGEESFGMLYLADISQFDPLPDSEIAEINLFSCLPERWTYPEIQPRLLEELLKRGCQG